MGNKKNKKNKQHNAPKPQQTNHESENSKETQNGNGKAEDQKQQTPNPPPTQVQEKIQTNIEQYPQIQQENVKKQQSTITMDESNATYSNILAQPENHQQVKIADETVIQKQQSLDTYVQLKQPYSKKESEVSYLIYDDTELEKQTYNKREIQALICIEDEQIPTLNLQPSPKSHKPLVIEITSYRTANFIKMATQFFEIKISNPNTKKVYEIERRFSDFADLYDQIFYNHPGYILYPFPNKTLQSFLKLKMGLSTEQGEICELIEKRMKALEEFLQWLSNHQELCNSEQFLIFISQQQKQYEQGSIRLTTYANEYKSLEKSSYFSNILEMGKQILTFFKIQTQSPTSQQPTSPLGIQYNNPKRVQISEYIKAQKQRLNNMLQQSNLLYEAEKSFSEFNGIQTDIDVLLKLCAKHVSGRDYCKRMSIFLSNEICDSLKQFTKEVEEAEKSLIHIAEIIHSIIESKKQLNFEKKAKLERRLVRAERNFQHDWEPFHQNCLTKQKKLAQSFKEEWEKFKLDMKKIWKPKQ